MIKTEPRWLNYEFE